MNARPSILVALLLAATACSNPAPAPADAAASASAPAPTATFASARGGDAGAAEDAGDAGPPRPPPPRVRALEVPEETKSPMPKNEEWKDAVRRDVAVRSEYTCTIQRLREWHRINCNCTNATVGLVAGTRDGVVVWANEEDATVVFPVRKNDRRAIQVVPHAKLVPTGHYGGIGEQPGGPPIVFSETWLDGEDAPTLVMQ